MIGVLVFAVLCALVSFLCHVVPLDHQLGINYWMRTADWHIKSNYKGVSI